MHENDFLDAYQLHMVKIEKELQLLKAKAAEQDSKLHQDTRIVQLQSQLEWFKKEFDAQMAIKSSNEEQIERLRQDITEMRRETREMKDEAKASKRQNKLLVTNLLRQQQNKEDLEQVSTMMDFERSRIIRDSAVMPDLRLNPFESLSFQMSR